MTAKVYEEAMSFWFPISRILDEEIEEGWELTHLQNFIDAIDQYHPNGEKEQGKAPKEVIIQALKTLMCVAYVRGYMNEDQPMIEEPTYEFCCWNCDNTTDVEFSTIQEMIADATANGWHVGKGRCYCPEHNPVTKREEVKDA